MLTFKKDEDNIMDFREFVAHATNDPDSRKVCYFLAINLAFTFVEVFTGLITNSLGLLSDAGHMFFDCSSLFISLGAAYVSTWPADESFPQGYAKVEILAVRVYFSSLFLTLPN